MKLLDKVFFKLGTWFLCRSRTVTATSKMLLERTRNARCDHCGLNPIHYLEDCECENKDLLTEKGK